MIDGKYTRHELRQLELREEKYKEELKKTQRVLGYVLLELCPFILFESSANVTLGMDSGEIGTIIREAKSVYGQISHRTS